jgi:hypothetical protein
MRTLDELQARLELYKEAEYIYVVGVGSIVWHYSSGDNIEILFIEAPNHGRELYHLMVSRLLSHNEKPYHSVFGFHLTSNTRAARFYEKMGWNHINLGQTIYRGEGATIVWTTWEGLLQNLGF